MKRLPLAVTLMVCLIGCSQEPSPEAERLFALGVERAEAGDHRGGAAAFEAVLDAGWVTPELLLNLAHVYAEAGDLGRARVYAERAERLAPRRAEVRAAKTRMARLAGDPPTRAQTLTEALAGRLARGIGAATLLGLGFALWLAVMAGAAIMLWFRPRGSIERVGLGALGLAALVVLGGAALTARYEHRPEVVVLNETALYAAPGGAEVGQVTAGRLLRRGTTEGTWQAVRLADGSEAWVAREQVEAL